MNVGTFLYKNKISPLGASRK